RADGRVGQPYASGRRARRRSWMAAACRCAQAMDKHWLLVWEWRQRSKRRASRDIPPAADNPTTVRAVSVLQHDEQRRRVRNGQRRSDVKTRAAELVTWSAGRGCCGPVVFGRWGFSAEYVRLSGASE